MTILRRAIRYGRGVIGLRADDVLLASFPRSGSTWLRFFLAHFVSLRELDGSAIGFERLNAMLPELGASDLLAPWPYTSIPRVVKTHLPYSMLLGAPRRRVLVVRDPRDAMVSYYLYEQGKTRPRYSGDFAGFLRCPLGLEAWFRHQRSWSPRATLELRYEELRAAEIDELRRLLDLLGVAAPTDLVEEAVRRSKLKRVRELEQRSGTGHEGRFREGFRFAGQGEAGGWRDWFAPADRELYATLHARSGLEAYPPQ